MSIEVRECTSAAEVREQARRVLEKRRAGYKRGANTVYYQKVKADIQKVHEPKPITDPILANIKQIKIDRPTSRMREIQCLIARLDFLRGKEPAARPSMSEIQIAVANAYRLDVNAMTSQLRHIHMVQARQVAMALCSILTLASTPMIGHRFGGRDHTTVLHALRRLRWLTDILQAELSLRDPPSVWATRAVALYPFIRAKRLDR